jgi:hypothetical protein
VNLFVVTRVPHAAGVQEVVPCERDHVTPRRFGSFATVAVKEVGVVEPGVIGDVCGPTLTITLEVIVILTDLVTGGRQFAPANVQSVP